MCPGRAVILEKPRRVVSSLDPGVRERDQTIARIGFPDRPFESRFYCGHFTESQIAQTRISRLHVHEGAILDHINGSF